MPGLRGKKVDLKRTMFAVTLPSLSTAPAAGKEERCDDATMRRKYLEAEYQRLPTQAARRPAGPAKRGAASGKQSVEETRKDLVLRRVVVSSRRRAAAQRNRDERLSSDRHSEVELIAIRLRELQRRTNLNPTVAAK